MRHQRYFEPFSHVLLDHEEGSTTVIRSPDSQAIPWRCQVRWADGGWTQVVAIDLGWIQEAGWPTEPRGAGYGEVQDLDPDDEVGPGPTLTLEQALVAVRRAMAGARSLELSRSVAAEARRYVERGLPPNYAGILHGAEDLGESVDRHPEAIAAIYQLLVDNGVEDPTAQIAEFIGKSRATAARRIAVARRKGLLGPARRGRAGSMSESLRGEDLQ